MMRGNRATDTSPEFSPARSAVHRLGLRYRKHRRPLPELRCRADLVFRPQRVAVFIDGCFWHGGSDHGTRPSTNSHYWGPKIERNRERDGRNDRLLAAAGWMVVRVWEHEAPEQAAAQVAAAVLAVSRSGLD